jgi:hypothetical protein
MNQSVGTMNVGEFASEYEWARRPLAPLPVPAVAPGEYHGGGYHVVAYITCSDEDPGHDCPSTARSRDISLGIRKVHVSRCPLVLRAEKTLQIQGQLMRLLSLIHPRGDGKG